MLRRRPMVWFAAAWLSSGSVVSAQTAPDQVDNIKQVFAKLGTCWRPPPPSQANPSIEITVIVSFRRDGTILGHPKITYESEQATDHDRLETLQRCTPMPFTEAMAGAVAGRPFAVKFHNRRPPPQPMEKRAWQLQKIL